MIQRTMSASNLALYKLAFTSSDSSQLRKIVCPSTKVTASICHESGPE